MSVKDTGIYTEEQLAVIREQLGNSLYALSFEMKLIGDDGKEFTDPNILSKEESKDELLYNGVGHIDARYTGKHYTAFTILKVNKEHKRIYAFGVTWDKNVDECLPEILKLWKRFRCGTVWSETNADKGYLAKDLKALKIQAKTYSEDLNKDVKIGHFLRKYWKRIYFLHATQEYEEALDEIADQNAKIYVSYLDQIQEYEEEADIDDAPDSLASCLRYYSNKPLRASQIMSDVGLKDRT